MNHPYETNAILWRDRREVTNRCLLKYLGTGKQNRGYFRMCKTVDKRNVLLKQNQKNIFVIKIRLKNCFLEEAGDKPACVCE